MVNHTVEFNLKPSYSDRLVLHSGSYLDISFGPATVMVGIHVDPAAQVVNRYTKRANKIFTNLCWVGRGGG